MAQQGSLFRSHGAWYVRFREPVKQSDGSLKWMHRAKRLGSVREYPKKGEARDLKNKYMERLNKIGFKPEAGVSVVDFAEKTFFPACEKRLKGGTVKCYRDSWNCHLREHLIGIRVRDFRAVDAQCALNEEEKKYGTTLAHGTYRHMKVTLSAILTEARNLGLYEGPNPTTGVRVPRGKKHGRRALAYSLDEILQHLDLFTGDSIVIDAENGPYQPRITGAQVRAIIGVTAFAGLRKGEIRGLWWDDDRGDVLAICRSIWRSDMTETKTQEDGDDPGLVPIIAPLRKLLDAARPEHPGVFMFPNLVDGALDLDNLAKRVIQPVLEASGLRWYGWHAYRRGLATALDDLGVPGNIIQAILRHSDFRTTERYIKRVPKTVKRGMSKLEKKIASRKTR